MPNLTNFHPILRAKDAYLSYMVFFLWATISSDTNNRGIKCRVISNHWFKSINLGFYSFFQLSKFTEHIQRNKQWMRQ